MLHNLLLQKQAKVIRRAQMLDCCGIAQTQTCSNRPVHLRRKCVLRLAVCRVQEYCGRPHKALQVRVVCEVRAESHVPAVNVFPPIR